MFERQQRKSAISKVNNPDIYRELFLYGTLPFLLSKVLAKTEEVMPGIACV
jgi:hypothetical protein